MPSPRTPRRRTLADALVVAALFAGGAAQAQTPACEQFKAELTARIARSPGTFRVEAVPSDTIAPAGGRVVGNCGGGKWKLVLLAGVTAPANPAVAPVREIRVSQPAAASSAVPVAAQPTAAVAREVPTARPAPAPPTTPFAASDPVSLPAAPPALVSLPMPNPVQAVAPASAVPSAWMSPASYALAWVAGAALLLITIVAGRWIAYRRHYDPAGLPRGPRLR